MKNNTKNYGKNYGKNYDKNNIFAKMIRGEIPCDFLYSSDYALAFKDISPQKAVHILVIPKKEFADFSDFTANASAEDQLGFWRAVQEVITKEKLTEKGYRLIANTGENGMQEVPHFHLHILAGERAGPLVTKNV